MIRYVKSIPSIIGEKVKFKFQLFHLSIPLWKSFQRRFQWTSTPASDHLFETKDEKNAIPLPEEQAMVFKHCIAQLLFLSLRACRDIQTAVAFLTTRVKVPHEDDWGKARHVFKYLKGTQNLKQILSVDKVRLTQWYVNGSCMVYHD